MSKIIIEGKVLDYDERRVKCHICGTEFVFSNEQAETMYIGNRYENEEIYGIECPLEDCGHVIEIEYIPDYSAPQPTKRYERLRYS